jgi:exopolyphosphatase / guanosine-5'-triphosphate,3'-diphosphate pyrophosphatase
MNIAIIDLGTNTFNLLIGEINKDKSYTILYNNKLSVKLGESINEGYISPASFRRGIEARGEFKKTSEDYSVSRIYAFATSAIRDAKNGLEFARIVKETVDIEVDVISGEQEAEFIYYGVREALDLGETKSIIMDIGGGSIEFIIANREKIFWKHSYNLGVARLIKKFQPSDPILPEEINQIEDYLDQELESLFVAVEKNPVDILVGSSGSFDTLAAMIAHQYYSPAILIGKMEYSFNLEHYFGIHQQLLKSTCEERFHTKGIIRMRADMIVLASIFVNFIIKKLKLKAMRLSTYSLKEGVLYSIQNKE